VLQKREIENYLLQPRALSVFLEKKTQSSPHPITSLDPDSISKLLAECANELQELTIGKLVARTLCRPVFASNTWMNEVASSGVKVSIQNEIDKQLMLITARREKISDVYDTASAMLLLRWDSEKLDMVPGTELLDKLFQRFNVRFRKETDSSRIAVLMTRDEIDQELLDFIRAVGR
jgi:putative ATP-dependent endonuclease of OLD family